MWRCVIVRNMDDDAAVLLMVDSNLQRENILPSDNDELSGSYIQNHSHANTKVDFYPL